MKKSEITKMYNLVNKLNNELFEVNNSCSMRLRIRLYDLLVELDTWDKNYLEQKTKDKK